ncbi:MAG: hypothetical protein ABIJ45_01650 [Candidatus Zixiibacteriota bacterium]
MTKIKSYKLIFVLIILTATFLLLNCQKPFIITIPLNENLLGSFCSIGEIVDDLPDDIRPYDKPTGENIEYFRNQLGSYLAETKIFKSVKLDNPIADYKVSCYLLRYNQSDSFEEFKTTALVNTALITVGIELINIRTNKIVFGLNLKEDVSYWASLKGKLFEYTAGHFAAALKKEMKKYR